MNIIGIEVIRGNPVVATEVGTGENIQLNVGDTLRVTVSLDYRGQAQIATLYGAIGSRLPVIGFDEYLVGQSSLPLPDSPTDFTPVEGSVDIEINAISSGTYDLYCKIREYPEAGLPEVSDVIEITGIYELVYTHDYPDTFVGKAEVCPFTFISLPEQIPGHEWLAEQLATILGESMVEHGEGSRMLRLQLWADTSQPLYTKYYGEATATASPVPWALVIGAIAIIAVIISFIVLINEVETIDWGEIPTPIPWAILAITAGVGILGVGAVFALAAPKR